MPACYCSYFHCDGQLVDDKTRKQHERFDASESYHNHIQVYRQYNFDLDVRLILFQHNANGNDAPIHIQDHRRPGDALVAMSDVESRKGHARCHQAGVPGRSPIADHVTKALSSLVELEQSAASQTKAVQALTSQAPSSPPTRALFDKIKKRRMGMEATLAAVNNIWCKNGSMAMSIREDLKNNLQKGIEDMRKLKNVLTNLAEVGTTHQIISANKPSKDLRRTHIYDIY
ncbi:hypothetical protein BC826DRAFT_1112023 [Russula brevipes]|nr:hypothetical protein BC826DRAFT_1112023 [Russula brevipes]